MPLQGRWSARGGGAGGGWPGAGALISISTSISFFIHFHFHSLSFLLPFPFSLVFIPSFIFGSLPFSFPSNFSLISLVFILAVTHLRVHIPSFFCFFSLCYICVIYFSVLFCVPMCSNLLTCLFSCFPLFSLFSPLTQQLHHNENEI